MPVHSLNRSLNYTLNRSLTDSRVAHWGNGMEWKRKGISESHLTIHRYVSNARATSHEPVRTPTNGWSK